MEKSVFRKKNGIIFRPDFELHINETLTCLPLKTASCNVTPHYYCNTLICHIPFYCDISSANNNIKIMQATVTHSHQQFVALRVRDALGSGKSNKIAVIRFISRVYPIPIRLMISRHISPRRVARSTRF